MFFHIIIPTLGRPGLQNAIDSIKAQTYTNYMYYVVHDNADSYHVYDEWQDHVDIYLPGHNGCGGCRNAAIKRIEESMCDKGEYILFLDDDDVIANPRVLSELADFIVNNAYPDMVRLPYIKHFVESGIDKIKKVEERDILETTLSPIVGSPTKAVKVDKIVAFEPVIKSQDVIQHIKQCDVCDTVAVFDKPYFIYNMYDRPDKAVDSPESKLLKAKVPHILRDSDYNRRVSYRAADTWAQKIEKMFDISTSNLPKGEDTGVRF